MTHDTTPPALDPSPRNPSSPPPTGVQSAFRIAFYIGIGGVAVGYGFLNTGILIVGGPILGLSVALLFLLAVVRIVYYTLGQSRARLSEWIATLGFCSAALAPIAVLVKTYARPDSQQILVLVLAALVGAWAFVGSAWGWTAINRLDERDGGRRLWLLAQGWLLVPGIVGCPVFGFGAVGLCFAVFFDIADGGRRSISLLAPLGSMLAFIASIAAAIPALRTELSLHGSPRQPPPGAGAFPAAAPTLAGPSRAGPKR